MKNILNKIKINSFTYYFLLICFFCGMIKNAIILFLIVVIHEIGHIISIKLFKYEIESINIYPFGGMTYINKPINSSITKDLVIALSGVCFQFIIIYLIINNINFTDNTLNIITNYNKTIIIFNLLPIIPLDGSKIIQDILFYFFSYKMSYFFTIIISIISIIFFINYNIIYSLNNYLVILILMFYIFKSIKSFKFVFNKFLLERVLYTFKYKKIVNNTKKIDDLKLERLHYFKDKNKYIKESEKIRKRFDKNSYF